MSHIINFNLKKNSNWAWKQNYVNPHKITISIETKRYMKISKSNSEKNVTVEIA